MMPEDLRTLQPMLEKKMEFLLLASPWLICSCCSHLESEVVVGMISLCRSLTNIFFPNKKSLKCNNSQGTVTELLRCHLGYPRPISERLDFSIIFLQSGFLLMYTLMDSRHWVSYLGLFHQCERTGWSSWLLTLA